MVQCKCIAEYIPYIICNTMHCTIYMNCAYNHITKCCNLCMLEYLKTGFFIFWNRQLPIPLSPAKQTKRQFPSKLRSFLTQCVTSGRTCKSSQDSLSPSPSLNLFCAQKAWRSGEIGRSEQNSLITSVFFQRLQVTMLSHTQRSLLLLLLNPLEDHFRAHPTNQNPHPSRRWPQR